MVWKTAEPEHRTETATDWASVLMGILFGRLDENVNVDGEKEIVSIAIFVSKIGRKPLVPKDGS